MPEPFETFLAVFSFAATGLLALGLLFARFWHTQPARAHGILAASLAATLLVPASFFTVRGVNAGLLAPQVEPSTIMNGEVDPAIAPFHNSRPAVQEAAVATPSEPLRATLVKNNAPSLAMRAGQSITSAGSIDPEIEAKPSQSEAGSERIVSWKVLLLGGWLLLSSVMAVRLVIDGYAGHRLVRASRLLADDEPNKQLTRLAQKMGVVSGVALGGSDRLASPVLWGWSSPPRILIPNRDRSAGFSDGVYLHELAHLARRDHLWTLASELVFTLLPWHPLAWWTRRTLAVRAEEACDDWVIACGCDPLDYADELLDLAPSVKVAFTMAAVTRGSSLKDRVTRLIHGDFLSPRLGRFWVMGLGLLALLAASGLALFQPRITRAETPVGSERETTAENLGSLAPVPPTKSQGVHRFLVHAQGKPVPNAKVRIEKMMMEGNQIKRFAHAEILKTDALGVTGTSWRLDPYRIHGISYAEDDAGRLAIMDVYPVPGYVTKLEIKPTSPIRGRVVHAGKPLAGVRCQLITFQRLDLSLVQDYPFPLYRPLQECRTDEKGEFLLKGIPDGYAGQVLLDQEGFGLAKASILAGEFPTIELARAGDLEIVFAGEGNSAQLERMGWSLKDLSESIELSAPLRLSYGRTWRTDTIQAGKILRLGAGKFQLTTKHRGREPFDLGKPVNIEVHAGRTTKITLQAESLAEISGKVVEDKTGKGIEGIRVEFTGDRDSHPMTADWGSVDTNQDGTFKIYCKGDDRYSLKIYQIDNIDGGKVQYYQKDGPFGFAKHVRLKKSQKLVLPDMAMNRGISHRIPVLDEKGKPLTTSFEAYLAMPLSDNSREPFSRIVHEDGFSFASGIVITPQLDPDGRMAVLIRRGKAVNIPEFFAPSRVPNPEAIVTSSDYGVTVRGMVVDLQGEPVKGVQVKLESGRTILGQAQTSDRGEFEFSGLWSGLHYRISADFVSDKWYEGFVDFDTIKDAKKQDDQNLDKLKITLQILGKN